MKYPKLSVVKIISLIFVFTLFITGCGGQIVTDPNFKDITNKIVLETASQGSTDETTSENESVNTNTDISSNVSSDNSSTDNISSEDYTASEETKEEVQERDYKFSIENIKNVQKFGVESRVSPKYVLANIAYMKGNVIKDTLFDGLVFCNPNSMFYNYSLPGSIAKLTQKDYLNIIEMGYKPGVNVNAVEEAAGVMKEVLGIPEYKVGIFFSLLRPVDSIENWGVIEGRTINLKEHPEDRATVLKWLVDEHIKASKKTLKKIILI